jgi:hypothetical protein
MRDRQAGHAQTSDLPEWNPSRCLLRSTPPSLPVCRRELFARRLWVGAEALVLAVAWHYSRRPVLDWALPLSHLAVVPPRRN